MTCDEIFKKIINHMVEGLMVHEELSNYYLFLGLPKYAKCHEKHYFSENKTYKKFYNYYITTYNKLIPNIRVSVPEVIPQSWYQYVRQDVDMKTKQTAVKSGLEKWVEWEQDTYVLYQEMYKELIALNKVHDAIIVKELICDVKEELDNITQYHLNKLSTNYDMVYITEEQK